MVMNRDSAHEHGAQRHNQQLNTEAQVRPELLSFTGKVIMTRRPFLSTIVTTIIDWLYPPRCAGCGRLDTHWCAMCQREIDTEPVYFPLPLYPPIAAAATTSHYTGKIRRAIKALKYDNAQALSDVFARRMEACLRETKWIYDTLIPVPLHKDHFHQRGYNQAYSIAHALAQRIGVPVEANAIERWRSTRSQVGLNREARMQNVHNAFRASPTLSQGRTFLLIDDVCTTGATLQSCAQALANAGAQRIYCLTVSAARLR